MKTLLFFLSLILQGSLFGQIITTSINDRIPCCTFTDSIDYNSDGIFDIKIKSDYGFDNRVFFAMGNSNLFVTSAVNSGQSFSNFQSYFSLANTSMGCSGWSWVPGNNYKYFGFRHIVSANDTIFGWVKVSFHGIQNTCNDTIITYSVAYNSVHNSHIYAGETSTDIIQFNTEDDLIEVFPNPATHFLYIKNKNSVNMTIRLFNITGKQIFNLTEIKSKNIEKINIERLPKGLYLLECANDNQTILKKIIVE